MQLRIYDPRILAIDLRPRRFGYALFEGPRLLLDWGISSYPSMVEGGAEVAARRLQALLRMSSPSAIVVKTERWERAAASSSTRALTVAISREVSERSLPIRLIGQRELRGTFLNLQCETKYEIAAVLARIFPELLWKVPPKRQIWQTEHPRMAMFDAIALGLAYWQNSYIELPHSPEES